MDAKSQNTIGIAPHHDRHALAAEFRKRGRLHIPDFVRDEDAHRLFDALSRRTPWNLTIIHDGGRDITPGQWQALSERQKAEIHQEVIRAARTRFEGRYCTLRLSDHGEPFEGSVAELVELTRFLNCPEFLDFMRTVTGLEDIAFCDAQATLYTPGDFLTVHTDENVERGRLAAYVFNLTPVWKAEWGGLLCFIDDRQNVIDTFTPAWNAINVFRVPQAHYVSFVAPYSGHGRYSVTGWMRAS